ncbi:MAG: PEP-CTERM sorting domain-containing protein [Verrucomicrobia bacterium]|nr:PEP-CTERM sorting domain-containing protein [Verrucomicrobiota bacterium]
MKKVLTLAVILCSSTAFSAPLIVDSFNFGNPGIFYAGVPAAPTTIGPVTETLLTEVIGGTRKSTLAVNTFAGGVISLSTFSGVLNHSNPAGGDSDATFLYDNFSNIDFTQGGANTFIQAVFISTDLGTVLDITLDDGANSNTQSITAPAGGAQSLYFNLTAFSGAGVDVTSVDKVTVKISGPSALDSRLDFVETSPTVVPEPGTMGLMSLGLLALARRRR